MFSAPHNQQPLPPRGPRAWTHAGILCLAGAALAFLLLPGCVSSERRKPDNTERVNLTQAELKALQPNIPIGQISWVEEETGHAIFILDFGAPVPTPGRILVARDHSFRPTAVLEATGMREGQRIAVVVRWGDPRVEDEVIIPDAELRRSIARLGIDPGE